jgi:hypothetical protein
MFHREDSDARVRSEAVAKSYSAFRSALAQPLLITKSRGGLAAQLARADITPIRKTEKPRPSGPPPSQPPLRPAAQATRSPASTLLGDLLRQAVRL